jgi:hypothetical protein
MGSVIPLDGTCAGGRYGFAMAAARDVNGDGVDDLAIASPWCGGGRFEVRAGGTVNPLQTVQQTQTLAQTDARFGVSLAGVGDVNGDGYADVLAGAYLYDNGTIDSAGRAALFYGGPTPPSPWVRVTGVAGARFGRSVGAAGDVNGDGYADLLIGAPRYVESTGGRAFVFLGSGTGPGTSPSWTSPDIEASSEMGTAVSGAGDINGDGYSDILMGAPFAGSTDQGEVYVQYGNAGKDSRLGMRLQAQRRLTSTPIVPGAKAASTFGFDVAVLKAKNPAGRSPISLVFEVKARGVPYSLTNSQTAASEGAAAGYMIEGTYTAGPNDGPTPHFRARTQYVPSASPPWSLHSPWRYGGFLGDPLSGALRLVP